MFNANPLLRFDGTSCCPIGWIFESIRRRRAKNWESDRHILLGEPMPADDLSGRGATATELYGAASWLCALSSLAVLRDHGNFDLSRRRLGARDSGGRPLVRVARFCESCSPSRNMGCRSFARVASCGRNRLWRRCISWRRWSASHSRRAVRASCDWPTNALCALLRPGLFAPLHVSDGERVEAGQLIAELENLDLEAGVAASDGGRRAVAGQSRGCSSSSATSLSGKSSWPAASPWRKRRAELTRRNAALELRAPTAGRVFARRLNEVVGRLPGCGRLLCVIRRRRATRSARIDSPGRGAEVRRRGRFPRFTFRRGWNLLSRRTDLCGTAGHSRTCRAGLGRDKRRRDRRARTSRPERKGAAVGSARAEIRRRHSHRGRRSAGDGTTLRTCSCRGPRPSSLAERLWTLARDKWRATSKRG